MKRSTQQHMNIFKRLFNYLFRRGWRDLVFRGTPIIDDKEDASA